MSHAGKGIVFRVESHDTSALAVGINNLERGLNAICLSINLVSSIERLEEFADIVAGVVLLECQLGIRPDLLNVNKVMERFLDGLIHTF